MHGLFLAAVAWLLLTGSAPVGHVRDTYTFGIYYFWHGSMVVWALLLVVHVVARGVLWRIRAHQPRIERTWLVVPLALAGFWGLHHYGVVWWARWHLSRGAFERLAATPTSQWQPGLYGVFYITRIRQLPNGSVRLDVGFPDLYSDGCPEFELAAGPWPERGQPRMHPIGGGWWFLWNNT